MFVTCTFSADGTGRAYTYACDVDGVEPGSSVIVRGPQGDEKIVTVLDTDVPEPPFECKPILRIHVPDEDQSAEASQ